MEDKEKRLCEEEEALDQEIKEYTEKLQKLMVAPENPEENFLYLTKEDLNFAMKFLREPSDTVMIVKANKEAIIEYPAEETKGESIVNLRGDGRPMEISVVRPQAKNLN